MVVSMLVKSICRRSNGAVATITCRGTLGKLPSCYRQCMQFLMDCCIWLIIPGQQKCSCSNDKVWSQPWWPASLWHPFKVATRWALGTTNSSKSSVAPLGIECRYKAPWWIKKFCQFCKIIWPSLLEVCSARRALNLFPSGPSASPILHTAPGPLFGLLPNLLNASVQACNLQWHYFLF